MDKTQNFKQEIANELGIHEILKISKVSQDAKDIKNIISREQNNKNKNDV